jgi:hypothetical protein
VIALGQAHIRLYLTKSHIIEELKPLKTLKMLITLPPDLRSQIREIRSIQIIQEDLRCLIEYRRKIASTAMNAFCARLQDLDDEASRDYVVFSSWLGPLVSGKVMGGTMAGYGSVEGHILTAVRCQLQTLYRDLSC